MSRLVNSFLAHYSSLPLPGVFATTTSSDSMGYYLPDTRPSRRSRILIQRGRTRQTLLGRSATNQLIIVAPPIEESNIKSPPPHPSRGIHSLPDEVLLNLLEILSAKSSIERNPDSRRLLPVSPALVALSIVCMRFHQLVTPFIYGQLDVFNHQTDWRNNTEDTRFRHLHRTLSENVSLRAHCQRFIVISFESKHDDRIMDMMGRLTSARHLCIQGRLGNGGIGQRVLSAAVRYLPHLKSLSLDEWIYGDRFWLRRVCDALKDVQYLGHLSIHGAKGRSSLSLKDIKVSLVTCNF